MILIETNYKVNKILIRNKGRKFSKHNLTDNNFSRIMNYISFKRRTNNITPYLTTNGWITTIK
jgi:hypothetical protein